MQIDKPLILECVVEPAEAEVQWFRGNTALKGSNNGPTRSVKVDSFTANDYGLVFELKSEKHEQYVQTQFSTYFAKVIGSDNIQVNDPLRILTISPPASTSAPANTSVAPKEINQISVKRGEKATISLTSDKPATTVYWFKERHELYFDEFLSPP